MQPKEEEPPKRTVGVGKLFIQEFPNYSKEMQDAINDVRKTFLTHGLEKSAYKGKIKNSWSGSGIALEIRQFTKENNLWHVHLGLPTFQLSKNSKFYTSDYVLHFQFDPNNEKHIRFIKATPHYAPIGPKKFILPTTACLE